MPNGAAAARTRYPVRTKFTRKLALVGIIPIKFSTLSAPTKIEELTAGSDEKTVEKELKAW